jgi:hypothetical protein
MATSALRNGTMLHISSITAGGSQAMPWMSRSSTASCLISGREINILGSSSQLTTPWQERTEDFGQGTEPRGEPVRPLCQL